MADLTGKTLGRYRLVERIGRGGMATVYKAYQPALERYVAVKVMHEQLAAGDDQFFKRFQREAKAVAALRHPNIVQVFDFGVEDEVPYMVMEYLEGVTLKRELQALTEQGETMPPGEAGRIFQAIAAAVAHAHAQGMAHRDLKPANVMLTTKGEVVLTDFGIARIVGGTQYTATGAILGTPAYMSPEQGQGQGGDERSDVYALGVMLYEMVTGRVPFDADTPLAVIYKHISDPLPLPRHLNPTLPEGVEQVILKALAKRPEDRYQRVADMAQALADALAGETATLAPESYATQVVAAPGPEPASPGSVPIPAAPAAGLPAWAWAAGGLILGGLLVLAGLLATGRIGGGGAGVPTLADLTAAPGATPLMPAVAATETAPAGPTAAMAGPPAGTGAIIVDNADPGFRVEAGEWGDCEFDSCEGTSYGLDFRWAEPDCTACRARFDLQVPAAGEYEAWAWWPKGSDRATDTPFTLSSGQDSFTVRVDQRNQGSTWYRLGQVSLAAGEPVSVVVGGSASGYANADAVALAPAGAGPPVTELRGVAELPAGAIVVDNSDPAFHIEGGDWSDCWDGDCGGTVHGEDMLYADPGCVACRARFDLRAATAGEYEIWTWWPQGADRSMTTPFTVQGGGETFTVFVDQRLNGNAWYRLGQVSLGAGDSVGVVVGGSRTGYANADAVALAPAGSSAGTVEGSPLCPGPYPPLIGDREVRQAPDLDEPPARSPFRDPVFGTCLVRVTDRAADVSAGDPSTGLKNEYARVQSFNADGSRLLARGTEATWYLYDAASLQPLGELPLVTEPRWDAENPNQLYYSDETRLLAFDIGQGQASLVHDFAADLPGQAPLAVWTGDEGSPSADRRYWAFMAEDENWIPTAFLVYDRLADRVAALRDVRGLPGIEEDVDHVTMSPLGTYFLAAFDRACAEGQLGSDARPCGLMVYDRDLANGRGLLRIIGHYDTALDAGGREVVIYQDIEADHISLLDLASGAVTALWPIDFSHTPIGLHFSGLAFERPGWALVSTYSGGYPTAFTWMDNQVFAVELKAGGRVARLAHTHSIVDENQEHDYWAEPQASVNPDFTRVLFTSNWGRSGTGEVDMFMIELPPDWASQLP